MEGQLGNGVYGDRLKPTLVARLALVCVAQVCCGDKHTVSASPPPLPCSKAAGRFVTGG